MIQDDAWARINSLAAELGWERPRALGAVVALWRNSQACGVHRVSKRVLLAYTEEQDRSVHEDMLTALQREHVRFVHEVEPELYEIHGNKQNIDSTKRTRELNSLKAQKRWEMERARQASDLESLRGGPVDESASEDAGGMPSAYRRHAAGIAAEHAAAMPKLNQAKPSQAKRTKCSNPPMPPRRGTNGGRRRASGLRKRATAFATLAIGARRNNLCERDALASIGDEGWSLLMRKYGAWPDFCRAYEVACRSKGAQTFESQLRASFEALLDQALEA